jgi:hypothetical protein
MYIEFIDLPKRKSRLLQAYLKTKHEDPLSLCLLQHQALRQHYRLAPVTSRDSVAIASTHICRIVLEAVNNDALPAVHKRTAMVALCKCFPRR